MPEKLVAHLEDKIQFSELKLYSLLEITTAINLNEPVEQLLRIYEFILREQLGISKFLLIAKNSDWDTIVRAGFRGKIKGTEIEADLNRFDEITVIQSSHNPLLNEFDVVIPVTHKEQKLAFLLVGDLLGDQIKLSDKHQETAFLRTLTNILVVALENKRMTHEGLKQAKLKKELEVASEMQRLLFPAELPKNKQMDVAATYKTRHEVGGDYYDFFPLSEHEYILCIADVSGKGVAAAMLMANFQATLRTICNYKRFPLKDLVNELNEAVYRRAKGEKFITFFIAEYHTQTRELTYVNAGHNHPILTNGRKHQFLGTGTIGLGMLSELPFIESETLTLSKNTTLVLYTDGVVELENETGVPFDVDGLLKVFKNFYPLKTDDLNDLVFSKLDEWKGKAKYVDDTAIFTCRFF
jgi:phosphoserine phosphatase RsbU/P